MAKKNKKIPNFNKRAKKSAKAEDEVKDPTEVEDESRSAEEEEETEEEGRQDDSESDDDEDEEADGRSDSEEEEDTEGRSEDSDEDEEEESDEEEDDEETEGKGARSYRSDDEEKKVSEVTFIPESLNEKERTVDFVMATDAPADMGYCYEILGMEAGEIRTKRLDKGIVPLLDSHPQRQWKPQSIDDQVGVVVSYEIKNGQLIGKLRFAKDERSERAFRKVADGIVRTGSIGYYVYKSNNITPEGASKETYRAVDWEPVEFSLVSIPADPDAQSRSLNKPKTRIAKKLKQERRAKDMLTTAQVLKIQASARSLGLDVEKVDEMIRAGKMTEQDINQELIKMAATARESVNPMHVSVDSVTKQEERVTAIQEALRHRNDPSVKIEGLAREFANLSLIEMQRESLRLSGKDVRRMNREEIIRSAFMGTSDFPLALGSEIQREAGKGYEYVAKDFASFVRETSRNDFKKAGTVSLSEAPKLLPKNEKGEFETGRFEENGEDFQIKTFGRNIRITRETFINDDIGILSDVPFKMGFAGGRTVYDLVYDLFEKGVMSDKKLLFHADHKNLLNGTKASVEALAEALLLMLRQQKAPGGADMNYNPGTLIVGSDLEIAAKKLFAPIVAAKPEDVNVIGSTFDGLVVSHKIPAKTMILSGKKEEVGMINLAFLRGNRGVNVIEKDRGATGIDYEVFMDAGAGLEDYRGFCKGKIA